MINTAQINTVAMERFSRLAMNHRLAHAYLLVGPQDSGKTQTALSMAQLVNCESEASRPCGECPACRKIASGNHPDVHILGNDEMDSIKIEDIRFLLSRAHLMAYEARTKVFIIRNIELMTLEAANALSKNVFYIDEFIADEIKKGNIQASSFTKEKRAVKLHGHCQQKSLSSVAPSVKLLSFPENYTVETIPSGCCGMAGSLRLPRRAAGAAAHRAAPAGAWNEP